MGRDPDELGPHGCFVVHVDERGHANSRFVETDVLRFHREVVPVAWSETKDGLTERIQERFEELSLAEHGVDLLVEVVLEGDGPLVHEALRGPLVAEWLEWLRIEYGCKQPSLWCHRIDVEPPVIVPQHNEQQTLLGDFLRQIAGYQQTGTAPRGLAGLLDPLDAPPVPARMWELDEAGRDRLLRDVAALGNELLSADEQHLDAR